MANLTITSVRVVANYVPLNGVAEEALAPGAPVRFAADGRLTGANATGAGEAAIEGIAIDEAARVGQAITYTRHGLLDVGNALDALAVGATVYLSNTDKTLADAAGTVNVPVGTVVPAWSGMTADKLLLIDVR